jgi:hypothetical protein
MLVQGTRLVDEKAILYPQENFQFSYETWDMSRMLCQKATCVHGTSNGGVIHRKVEPRLSIWIVLPHVILTAIQWDRQRQYSIFLLNFRGVQDLIRLHTESAKTRTQLTLMLCSLYHIQCVGQWRSKTKVVAVVKNMIKKQE